MKRAESLHGPLHSLECKLSSFVSIFSLALTRVRRVVTVLAAVTVLGTLWSAPACAIEYIYDELGRVVGVVDSTGASVRYNYDGLGNIVSIDRFGVAAISILEFTPNRGPIGTSVTISGTGFSATLAQNTVQFNGVTATITTATTTQLVVTVPATATTGKITVTAPAGTATSTTDFVIGAATAGAPTVTSFTPASGVAGTVVAVTGTNFDPASSATAVRFNESRAGSVTAVTATTLNATVPANTGSGRIRVVTANGSGSSATDFIIPPSGILAADMVANRRITVGGAGQALTIATVNKVGALLFDAAAGDYLTLNVTAISTTPAASAVTYQIYDPRNVLVASGSVSAPRSIHIPQIATTGTHTIYFRPTTSTATLTAAVVANKAIVLNGASLTETITFTRQTARLSFPGTAGQNLGIGITGLTLTPTTATYATVVVYSPTNVQIASTNCYTNGNGCDINLANLAATGTYSVVVTPVSGATGSFAATLSSDLTGTLTAGTAFNLNLARAGQNGRLSFSGTAGQNVGLTLSAVTFTGTGATGVGSITVYKPDGTTLLGTTSFAAGATTIRDLPALPTTGTYTFFIDPPSSATASLSVLVSTDVLATLILNGTPSNVSIAQTGQTARLSFAGTAGQNLGFGITGLTLTPTTAAYATVVVYSPTNTALVSTNCLTNGGGCGINLANLAATGTYSVVVTPVSGATGSFAATLSSDLTGTLTAGTAFNLNLARAGQNGRLSFSGTAGQNVGLTLSAVTFTGATGNGVVTVYKPDGIALASRSFTAGTTTVLDLPTLPTTGTYTFFIDPPSSVTANLSVLASADVLATLTLNGTPTNVSVAQIGQTARLSFAGTAGQNLGIGLTGLTLTPITATYATVTAYSPTNVQIASTNCFTTGGGNGCGINLANLAATGTYSVVVTPASGATGSFTATLSSDLTGTLTAGTAFNLSLTRAGQNGRLSFSGTAGQNLGLTLSAVTFTGPGATGAGYVTVYKPDGTYLSNMGFAAGTTTILDLPTLPTTGTYTVFIDPPSAATASMNVLVSADVLASLTLNGTPTNVSIAQTGQTARLSFAGTAGQNLGIGLTSLTLTPTTETYATVIVYSPTNVQIASTNCLTNGSGCGINLANLAATGTYSVVVTPINGATGSFTATLSSDVAGTLTAGTAFNLALTRAGQNGRLSFSGTAGQNLSLTLSAVTFTGATGVGSIIIYKPDGTILNTSSITSYGTTTALNLSTLPITGIYTFFIDPPSSATANLSVLVSADVLATLALNGTPTNVSITQTGQTARLSFAGTAGQNLGIGLTGLVLTPATYATVVVYSPTNTVLASTYCASGGGDYDCGINLPNLTTTGTYSVVVTPDSAATGSFTVTLSSDLTGTLTAGTTFNLNLARAGQNGRLSFSGTAGQNLGLTLSAVTFTGAPGMGSVIIYKPDGTILTSTPFITGAIRVLDLPTLPTMGTYTVFIDPPASATASMSVLVSADVLATLSLNGTPSNVSIAQTGQTARLSFAGTAGQNVGIGITGLTLTPTTATYATVVVYSPTNVIIASTTCSTNGSGCGINLPNLAATGTYSVVVTPDGGATGSFTATLSSDLTGTLTAGTAFNLNLARAGQNGRLSFSGTAGQNRTLSFASIVKNPTTAVVSFTVYQPNGTAFTSTSTSAASTTLNLNALPVTGTYTLFVDPASNATASMAITLSP